MKELLELTADLVGGRATMALMNATFDKMVVAEHLIYKRMRDADDETRRRYWNAFMDLTPPAVFHGMDDRLYKSHVEELLDRIGDDDADVVPLTEAESLAYLSKASMEHPPDRYAYAYFTYLFQRIYADDPRAQKFLPELDSFSGPDSPVGFAVQTGRERFARLKSDRTNKRPPPRDVPENVLAALERGDPEW